MAVSRENFHRLHLLQMPSHADAPNLVHGMHQVLAGLHGTRCTRNCAKFVVSALEEYFDLFSYLENFADSF